MYKTLPESGRHLKYTQHILKLALPDLYTPPDCPVPRTNMTFKTIFTESVVVKYVRNIRATPREMMVNPTLLFSCAVYAMAGLPTSKHVIPLLIGTHANLAIQLGIKVPHPLSHRFQASRSSSTSAPARPQTRSRTSSPLCILAML